MDSNTPSLFNAVEARLKWASKRQALIAENIANADTPGFKAKDLKPIDFKSVLKNTSSSGASTMATTDSHHIMPARSSGGFKMDVSKSTGTSLSGNSVDLEQESIKMALTRDQHTLASTVYRKYTDMLKLAIGKGGLQ